MMNNDDSSIVSIASVIEQSPPGSVLNALRGEDPAPSIHLGVLVQPYLSYVLDGSKVVESRFSAICVPPFRSVHIGDVILLKAAGGPIVGACLASATLYFSKPDEGTMCTVRDRFGVLIRAEDPEFWASRMNPSYLSLILLSEVLVFPCAVASNKRDRRGWVVVRQSSHQMKLFQ